MNKPVSPSHLPSHLRADGKTLADFMPDAHFTAEGSSFTATAGRECAPPFAAHGDLIAALKSIYDPEIPINIFDLGLIYKIAQDDKGDLDVEMTLTAPGCPVAGTFPGQVAQTLAALKGVGRVQVALVWDPPWTKDKMSHDARLILEM